MAYLWGKYELKKYFEAKTIKQRRAEISKSSLMQDTELYTERVNDEYLYSISGKLSSVWNFRGDVLRRRYDGLEIIKVRENESRNDYVIADIYEAIQRNFKGSYITDVESSGRYDYPDNGESGGYWYVYKGIDNQAPTISGRDEDLGSKKSPFKKTFSVDDSDSGQELNVTVKLNSAVINTIKNATRRQDYEIDINDEKFNNLSLNQRNTIEITVEDGNGASAIRRYYFTKSNTNPTVSVQNSNMGEQNKPFSIKFTPDDADGDMITCKIFVGETQIADLGSVTAKRLQTYTFKKLDFAKLPNGEHKIRIEVKDSNGGIGYGFITFSKNVKSCWYKYKKELEGKPNQITIDVLAEVAEGAKMTIKVCNNALDSDPAWEVVEQGTAHKFSNKNKVNEHWAIGVWVTIERQKAVKASYFYGLVGHYS